MRTVSGKVDTKQRGVMTEAELVTQLLVGLRRQLLADEDTGADQHQAIDQLCGVRRCSAIDVHQGVLAGIGQVPGDCGLVTRSAGDQRIERDTPGVHGVRNQLDFFERNLRLVGHGGVPRCCCGWGVRGRVRRLLVRQP